MIDWFDRRVCSRIQDQNQGSFKAILFSLLLS